MFDIGAMLPKLDMCQEHTESMLAELFVSGGFCKKLKEMCPQTPAT